MLQPLFQPLVDCLHVHYREGRSGLLTLTKAVAHVASFCKRWSIVDFFESGDKQQYNPKQLVKLREARAVATVIRVQVFMDVTRLGGDPRPSGIGETIEEKLATLLSLQL